MHYALKDYGAQLDWNVGSLFCHDDVMFKYVKLCKEFRIAHPIKWAFGCIPSLMSSGMAVSFVTSVRMAVKTMEMYLESGIACRLALSNPHVDEKAIRDDWIDRELMLFLDKNSIDGAKNGVIVSSDILARYIRTYYPNLEIILSVVRPAYDVGYGMASDTLDWYSKKLENPLYDIVGVNSAKLSEDGFMQKLPHKDRIELIACKDCIRNCPYAKHHYEAALGVTKRLSSGELTPEKSKMLLDEVTSMCIANRRKHWDQASAYSEEDIRLLASMGYRRFQLADRMNSDDRFERDVAEYIFEYRHLRYFENMI